MMILPLCIIELTDPDDREIMTRVYIDYNRYMFKIAFQILHIESNAEDVVQDCWKSWCNPRDIKRIKLLYRKSAEELRLFIASSTKNKSYTFYNSEKKRLQPIEQKVDLFAATPFEKVPSTEETIEAKSRLQEIVKGIEALPAYQREMMRMRFLEGYETNEIAEMTGMKENAIRSILSQARSKLKLNLAMEEDSNG